MSIVDADGNDASAAYFNYVPLVTHAQSRSISDSARPRAPTSLRDRREERPLTRQRLDRGSATSPMNIELAWQDDPISGVAVYWQFTTTGDRIKRRRRPTAASDGLLGVAVLGS